MSTQEKQLKFADAASSRFTVAFVCLWEQCKVQFNSIQFMKTQNWESWWCCISNNLTTNIIIVFRFSEFKCWKFPPTSSSSSFIIHSVDFCLWSIIKIHKWIKDLFFENLDDAALATINSFYIYIYISSIYSLEKVSRGFEENKDNTAVILYLFQWGELCLPFLSHGFVVCSNIFKTFFAEFD